MPERPATPRALFPVALGLLTLGAAIIRIQVAATEPPHFDESYTAVHYVLGSVGHLLTTYDEPNNHLFHNLLAWASTGLFGDGPLALRLPALLAGVMLVPATGMLARRVVADANSTADPASAAGVPNEANHEPIRADDTLRGADHEVPAGQSSAATASGVVAATIVAAAPPLIAYSANARGYTMVLLLMVLQLWLTLGLARSSAGPRRRWAWLAWVVCGALAVWTIPTAVIGVFVATIWLIALGGRSLHAAATPILALVATGVAAATLYAPVLGQRGFSVDRFAAAPPRALITTLAHAWGAGLAAPLIAVAAALALVGLARRPALGAGATLAIGLLALPLVIALAGRLLPYSRTYLFLLPILAVLAGVGAARLVPVIAAKGRGAVGAAVCGMALVAIVAGATAQTRAAWGEDPPGPSPGDLRALLLDEPLPGPFRGVPPGLPVHLLPLAAPPFDRPQAQYALRGLGGSRVPLVLELPALRREPFTVLIATRREVEPAVALRSLGLDPQAFVSGSTFRGDAQLISVLAK